VIDFSFIHDRVAGLYCPDNGRPPVDPMILSPLGSLPDEARARARIDKVSIDFPERKFSAGAEKAPI
jgi:hypothetical protein